MASTLNGLIRTLAWGDYGTPRAGSAPRPGQSATAAFTDSAFTRSLATFSRVPGSSAAFRLNDNVTLSISFRRPPSFVMAWVFSSMSSADQGFLLNHEQGHYNITALICRDFFVDVMLLKTQNFPSDQAGKSRVTQIKHDSLDKIQTVQRLYDREVHPQQAAGNMNGPMQQAWDGFFRSAWTTARTPPSSAPNGTPHRVRLIDVIRASGRTI
jgi:hypothetical protein